jgi:hypothetical protein
MRERERESAHFAFVWNILYVQIVFIPLMQIDAPFNPLNTELHIYTNSFCATQEAYFRIIYKAQPVNAV